MSIRHAHRSRSSGQPRAPLRDREAAQGAHVDLARPIIRQAVLDSFAKLNPLHLLGNPVMLVVEIGAHRHDRPLSRRRLRQPRREAGSSPPPSPSGCGSRSCSPTSPRRWPRAAARRRPTRCAPCAATRWPSARRNGALEERLVVRAAQGRHRPRRRGRDHPRRRRRHRGRRLRQRGRDHRRVGARAQGAGHRHPQLGHRRHDRHQRLAAHPHHLQPRRDLPRPHDRARRGRRAAEDAERDRAEHPARRLHDHLPARRRHDPALRRATSAAT